MPLDGSSIPDDSPQISFSQMSSDQLINDPRIPQTLKDQVILRLQQVGLRVGLIKLSDFGRRDQDDELRYQALKEDQLRQWLDALKFQDLSAKVGALIQTEQVAVEKEINAISATINKLNQAKKGKGNAAKVESLRRARESLKQTKIELDGLEKERKQAQSFDDLEGVATSADTVAAAAKASRAATRKARKSMPSSSTKKASRPPTPSLDLDDDDDYGGPSLDLGSYGGSGKPATEELSEEGKEKLRKLMTARRAPPRPVKATGPKIKTTSKPVASSRPSPHNG